MGWIDLDLPLSGAASHRRYGPLGRNCVTCNDPARLAGGALGAAVVGWFLGAASAAGIPATDTLAYSGVLMDGASPTTGTRSIGVSLWTDATSANSAF